LLNHLYAPTRGSASLVKSAIRVANVNSEPLRLRVEPWGREFDLLGGASQEIDFEGPDGGMIEVEVQPGEVVVYGWVGSTVDDHVNQPGPAVPQTPRRVTLPHAD
jgi:hypothetical protein